MARKRRLSPKSVWDEEELLAAFTEAGVKPSHLQRVYKYLLRDPDLPWREIPELPKAAVQLLDRDFAHSTSTVAQRQTSSDGTTTKLLVRLQDGLDVEAVIMTYATTPGHTQRKEAASRAERLAERGEGPAGAGEDGASTAGSAREGAGEGERAEGAAAEAGPAGETDCSRESEASPSGAEEPHPLELRQRSTLCVSSQVGCQMGCTFCATGTMGLVGDLGAGEIVEQFVHASRLTSLRNVVFMGMGEPLNNYGAVRGAVRMLTAPALFGLKRSKVTVSTVGVVPRLLQMMEDLPGVSLALSLHAPSQALRQQIVPSARAYPLPKLMAAMDKYIEETCQKVFVEYVVLAGVNDSPAVARELGALLEGKRVVVNLIPWNPVFSPGISFSAPSQDAVLEMSRILREEHEIFCTIRVEMGSDISGACGQLVVEQGGAGRAAAAGACSSSEAPRTPVKDIEELSRRQGCA